MMFKGKMALLLICARSRRKKIERVELEGKCSLMNYQPPSGSTSNCIMWELEG